MAKYFRPHEIEGLKPELVEKLDAMREAAGVPILITCGVRTPEKNAEVDGKADSAHLHGLAVDIRCWSNETRYRLLRGAFAAGFKRIEVATAHIHVDIDDNKPQEIVWLGVSK